MRQCLGECKVNLLPKIKVEAGIVDEDFARMLSVITREVRARQVVDPKLCALPVENTVCVRCGGEGGDAIQVNRGDRKVLRISKYGKLGIM
jgi:nitrogen regulatory protein PII